MSTQRITVYKGRDNTETLQFLDGGTVQDLSDITRIKLILNSTVTIDSNVETAAFDFTTDTSQLDLALGGVTLTVGSYEGTEIVMYDSVNTSGVTWGKIDLLVKANYET
jgi:hypothetical protein